MDMSRSFSAPSEETMRQELQALSRKDLQALAKQEGVKANISSAAIIEELLRLANIAIDSQQAVKEVLPVMRAQGPAVHTDAPASSSHPIPSARRGASPAQPAILGKQVAAANRPSTGSAGSGGGGSRPDIAGTVDKDQATTASQQTVTAKPRPLPEAAKAPADVTSTSVSAGRSGNRRKRWEVPAAVAASEPHEQQVHHQMQQLSLGGDIQVDPLQQHRAAVHQQAGLQQQQQRPTSRPGVASTSSSILPARHGDVQQDQVPPQASRVQAAVQRLQQQPQPNQQQIAASAQTPAGNMLHTPMRVRVKDPATAATNGTAAAAAGSRPMQDVSRTAAAAVTPTKQKVQAFGGEVAAAPAPTAAPVRPPAAMAAGTAATAAAAAVPAGLMSPRLAVMGSARRVVPTQSKLAPSAAAATAAAGIRPATASAAPATAADSAAAVGSRPATAAAGGPPLTPLQKGARRAVPVEAEHQVLDEDRKLEMLVERCLRIANPDAPQSVLQGPEPAKRWLQQHLITPLRRAYPAADQLFEGAAAAAARSSSSTSCCLAAGYCHKAVLLYGPSGSGKTELVHALASEMGANLLYVPAGDLLKSHQEKGHRLLRALFKVSKRVSPTVICFDDAHRSFPADARMSNPNHPSHKLLVELTVQLQQLADMQAQLQDKLQRPNSGSSSSTAQPAQQSKVKKPAWGMFGGSKQQKQQDDDQQQQQQQQKPHAPAYQQLPGPIVVVFATRHPEALEPALLPLLPDRLLLDLPSVETREDILMAWLMAKEAAVGVPDVELLAKRTEGFSCTDLLQLSHEAAMRPVQERSHRAVSIRDFEAAFLKVKPSISPQRRMQLKAWSSQ